MPKVVEGGHIAIHDVNLIFPGKIWNAARLLLTSRNIKNPMTANTITCFQKCEKNTLKDRAKNAAYILPMIVKGTWGYPNMLLRGGSRWDFKL
ncbi:hypothetical protein [Lutispora sp.]|uniref:hypothetical protein n=1 Tax=Lutispora sp. TaxID=2828727 RepID=UPI00356764C3